MIHRSWRARPIPPKFLLAVLILLLALAGTWLIIKLRTKVPVVRNFDECVKAGNPILETYPEQCVHNGQSFFRPGQAPPRPY